MLPPYGSGVTRRTFLTAVVTDTHVDTPVLVGRDGEVHGVVGPQAVRGGPPGC